MSFNLLTKNEIFEALSERKIVIEPLLEQYQIDIASIDLRLDNCFGEFRTAKRSHIDPSNIEEEYKEYLDFVDLEFFKEAYYLQPKAFVLAQTFEYISLPNNIVGRLDGRSSVARQGLTIHAAAGLVDPGFKGHLVFELLNAGQMPLKLYPLMRIAKLFFFRTKDTEEYKGQYKIQVRIRPPKNDPDLVKIRKIIDAK